MLLNNWITPLYQDASLGVRGLLLQIQMCMNGEVRLKMRQSSGVFICSPHHNPFTGDWEWGEGLAPKTHSSFRENPQWDKRVKQQFWGNCTPQEQLHFCFPLLSSEEMFVVACRPDVCESVMVERHREDGGLEAGQQDMNKPYLAVGPPWTDCNLHPSPIRLNKSSYRKEFEMHSSVFNKVTSISLSLFLNYC